MARTFLHVDQLVDFLPGPDLPLPSHHTNVGDMKKNTRLGPLSVTKGHGQKQLYGTIRAN